MQPAYILTLLILLISSMAQFTKAFSKVNPLLARRSVVKYDIDKKVPDALVDKAFEAAVRAPNHFLTAPWRFYNLREGTNARSKLIGLNEEKRAVFEKVPNFLVITLKSEHDFASKLWLEDHAAVAASTQNFMLSLASDGVGSKWMTGAMGSSEKAIMKAVGANWDDEHFMGVIMYGFPQTPLSESAKVPKRKLDLDECLIDLD